MQACRSEYRHDLLTVTAMHMSCNTLLGPTTRASGKFGDVVRKRPLATWWATAVLRRIFGGLYGSAICRLFLHGCGRDATRVSKVNLTEGRNVVHEGLRGEWSTKRRWAVKKYTFWTERENATRKVRCWGRLENRWIRSPNVPNMLVVRDSDRVCRHEFEYAEVYASFTLSTATVTVMFPVFRVELILVKLFSGVVTCKVSGTEMLFALTPNDPRNHHSRARIRSTDMWFPYTRAYRVYTFKSRGYGLPELKPPPLENSVFCPFSHAWLSLLRIRCCDNYLEVFSTSQNLRGFSLKSENA